MSPLNHINFKNLAEQFYSILNDVDGRGETIKQRVEKLISATNFSNRPCAEKDFLNFLNDEKNIKALIIGTPTELDAFRKSQPPGLFWDGGANKGKGKSTKFGTEIIEIFNYAGFRQSKRAEWLANELKIKTCLYCNAQYTVHTGKKVYYTFDHFFSKKKYPYLSVSFFNLIPACDNCNRGKSDEEVELTDYRHPYFGKPLIEEFDFVLDPKGTVLHRIGLGESNLKINLNLKYNPVAKAHDEMFGLSDQYAAHNDVAMELLWKAHVYTNQYKDELKCLLQTAGIGTGELNRIITGNYSNPEDFHKRPLAKLTNDLAKDMGLI